MPQNTPRRLDASQPEPDPEKKGAATLRGLLSVMPLFAGLSARQLAALANIAVRRACRKGQDIFAEGDEGKGFYVVLGGRVKVFKMSPEGKEQILHVLGPGESFGEVPVFAGRDFPAHARALAPGAVLFFPREAFVALIRQDPSLAMNMLASLSVRLRSFASLIEDLSLREVPARVASYLLYLDRRSPAKGAVTLDISKAELASLLGTIPETLSRVLARLVRKGLISMASARIRILDRSGLETLAGVEPGQNPKGIGGTGRAR